MSKNRTLYIIIPAFGAAIIAALSQIIIPIGAVPITLQTFAVGLVAAIFKPREATLAALLYLILGAIGLPVFAGGSGGFQTFFSPIAGYILAYPLFAFITSKLTNADT
ncbi:biotin transporter BioY, partial [Streptococcus sp.]